VIDCLFSATSGHEDDAEMLFEFTLTNEVVEVPRTQAAFFTNDVGARGVIGEDWFDIVGGGFR
jgi:hypothetical protein